MPVEPDRQWIDANGATYNDELLPPPAGWRWITRVQWYATRDVDRGLLAPNSNRRAPRGIATDLTTLVQWAKDYDVNVTIARQGNLPYGESSVRVPTQISVNPVFGFEELDNPFRDTDCPNPECDAIINAGMFICPGCNKELLCADCGRGFGAAPLIAITHEESLVFGCNECVRVCREVGCSQTIPRTWRYCHQHGNHWTCDGCNVEFDRAALVAERNDPLLCPTCNRNRCTECDSTQATNTEEGQLCTPCFEQKMTQRMEPKDIQLLTPEQWLMESMPERPVRLVSIEQEFEAASPETGGYRGDSVCGNLLAKQLYDAGLSPYPTIASYHSSGHDMVAHVETDASVTSGGELIMQKLNLATTQDAGYLTQVAAIVGGMVDSDNIRFTTRCGLHIHVDAHGFSVPDSRNLVTLYSYLEDVLYRLGSAGFADHREIMYQGGYSLPIRKDKWGDIKKFGIEFLRRADHTDSLNLMHFYAAMKKCKCGAIEFGAMADCTCIRTKCTVEWRLFNGTGDARKLHAYIALVQAMMAWSQDRVINGEDFPALEFRANVKFTEQTTLKHAKLMDEWVERLGWMRRHLPLTQHEWESIFYCIAWSPLRHLGEATLAEIAAIERVVEPDRRIIAPVTAYRGVEPTRSRDRFVDGVCEDCHEPRPYCECDYDDRMPDEPEWG